MQMIFYKIFSKRWKPQNKVKIGDKNSIDLNASFIA